MALFLAKTLLIFARCVHWTDFKKMRLRAVYRTIAIYSGAVCLILVACLLESKGGERKLWGERGSGCADEDVDEDDVDDNAYQHQHPHHHQYRHHQHE